MFESDWFYYICGLIFAVFGYAYLENARRNISGLGSKVFVIPFAAWFCYEYFFVLFDSGDRIYQTVALLAGFCAVSPLIAFIWYGQYGEIRKKLLKGLLFICIWFFAWAVIKYLLELKNELALIGGFVCVLLVFGFGFIRKKSSDWLRNRQCKRQEKTWEIENRLKEEQKTKEAQREDALLEQIINEMKK